MASVTASKRAQAELVRTLDYLQAQAGTKNGDRLREPLRRRIGSSRRTSAAEPRPSCGREVRIVVVDPHLVFYRYHRRTDAVVTLRVLHGHRRIALDAL